MMQKEYRLNAQLIEWRISTHAVARFMERSNTINIDNALFVLGSAILDCEKKIGMLAIEDNLKPIGYTERQIICKDGGVAVVLIQDPSDEDYRTMSWDLVTYISPDLRNHWNDKAAKREFETLEQRC